MNFRSGSSALRACASSASRSSDVAPDSAPPSSTGSPRFHRGSMISFVLAPVEANIVAGEAGL